MVVAFPFTVNRTFIFLMFQHMSGQTGHCTSVQATWTVRTVAMDVFIHWYSCFWVFGEVCNLCKCHCCILTFDML